MRYHGDPAGEWDEWVCVDGGRLRAPQDWSPDSSEDEEGHVQGGVSAGAPESSITESALTDLIQRHIRNMPEYCEHTFTEARLLCTTTVAHTPAKLRQRFVSACMRDQVRAQEITMALHGTSGVTTDTH